jgi:D-sedoheptulose 7-phosphate isomerase
MISQQVSRLAVALREFDPTAPRIQGWGVVAAKVLLSGGRLLACASLESREQAQHLTRELAWRSEADRPPLAAIPLMLAGQQVRELGRPGDILICFAALEESRDLIDGVLAARESGLTTWALTGPGLSRLAEVCDDAVEVPGTDVNVIEELQLLAVHIFCATVDSCVRDSVRAGTSG